jgi:hypothetical protein
MSSMKDAVAAIDAVDAAYNAVAALPLHTLTRADQQAILSRYERLNKLLAVTERRLLGRLITEGRDGNRSSERTVSNAQPR